MDLNSPIGAPSDSYEVDFAEAIDGPDPSKPTNEYREASRKFLDVTAAAMDRIVSAQNPRIAAWHVAFALGLPCCWGRSMRSVAAKLGCSVEAISKGAVEFCDENDLPPSQYMKPLEAREEYRTARNKQLS